MFEKCTHTLRVPPDATLEQVRQAFIKLARRWPPEHFPARFTEIKSCSDMLNLEDAALEEYVNRIAKSEEIAFMIDLLPGSAKSLAADDADTVEPDLPAFLDLLNPDRRRQSMLACLEKIPFATALYRR